MEKLLELSQRMFAVDARLSSDAANVNHNIACLFKLYGRLVDRPDKLKRALEMFEPGHLLQRLEMARKEIEAVEPGLSVEIEQAIHEISKYKEA